MGIDFFYYEAFVKPRKRNMYLLSEYLLELSKYAGKMISMVLFK